MLGKFGKPLRVTALWAVLLTAGSSVFAIKDEESSDPRGSEERSQAVPRAASASSSSAVLPDMSNSMKALPALRKLWEEGEQTRAELRPALLRVAENLDLSQSGEGSQWNAFWFLWADDKEHERENRVALNETLWKMYEATSGKWVTLDTDDKWRIIYSLWNVGGEAQTENQRKLINPQLIQRVLHPLEGDNDRFRMALISLLWYDTPGPRKTENRNVLRWSVHAFAEEAHPPVEFWTNAMREMLKNSDNVEDQRVFQEITRGKYS